MVIFVSSIGRSGTRFLANLLSVCTDIPSFHAMEPHCHGDSNFSKAYAGETPDDLNTKISDIQKIHDQHGGYFESSQLFNRIFSREVLARFNDVRVIQLLRDPIEVSKSYYNRDSYPNHTDREARPWRIPLNTPLSEFCFEINNPTPIQQNLCDWLDNELKFQTLRPQFSKTTTLHFEDFGNLDAISRTLTEIAIDFDRDALKTHLSTGVGLETNSNKLSTRIEPLDIYEANELLGYLNTSTFPRNQFQNEIYTRFPFLEALTSKSYLKQGLLEKLFCQIRR